jgi:hypothetical protein
MHWWICLEGSSIRNNSFIDNTAEYYGGAISLFAPDTAELLIENNYFQGDSSTVGGALCAWNSQLLIRNNVFNSNQALNGGACYLECDVIPQEHRSVLINNSFSNNQASVGGAIRSLKTKPLILNSVFWNDNANTGPEIYISTSEFVEVAYTDIDLSLISGGTVIDGGGNINEDPLFEDPELLTISPVSPCLDMGINVFTCACGITNNCPAYDILGTGRPQSGGFEMGAYELFFVGIQSADPTQPEVYIYPNPTSGIVNCQWSNVDGQFVSLKLYDRIGREVLTVPVEQMAAGQHTLQFDISGLPAGVYFLKSTVGSQQSAVGKIIKL